MTEGKTYDQIARGVGYANRGTAHRVVMKALKERLADDVDVLRTLELDRLDALHVALWEKALDGDGRAATAILKIIDQRCRLFGLYPAREKVESKRTLIMSPEEAAEYDRRKRDDDESRAAVGSVEGNAREATRAVAAPGEAPTKSA